MHYNRRTKNNFRLILTVNPATKPVTGQFNFSRNATNGEQNWLHFVDTPPPLVLGKIRSVISFQVFIQVWTCRRFTMNDDIIIIYNQIICHDGLMKYWSYKRKAKPARKTIEPRKKIQYLFNKCLHYLFWYITLQHKYLI